MLQVAASFFPARTATAASTSAAIARHQPDSRSSPNAPASASARHARMYGTSWKWKGNPISDALYPAPQVEVDHYLAELRQARPRGLYSVPVGHVEKANRWHTRRLTR